MNRQLTFQKFHKTPLGRIFSTIVLCTFTLMASTSCVSIRVKEQKLEIEGEKSSLSMKMYVKKPDKDQEQYVIDGVRSTLFFENEKGEFVEVASSERGNWLLKNSPAGKYKLEIDEFMTVNGKKEELRGNRTREFSLKSDERAEIRVILKKVPVGFIIIISVLVIGIIIWAILKQDDFPDIGKLLVPPLPSPRLLPPLPKARPIPLPLFTPFGRVYIGPSPVFIDGAFYASHHRDEEEKLTDEDLMPEATSFFPQMNAENVPGDTPIHVFFSTDMEASSFEEDRLIRVIGAESGRMKGTMSYDSSRRKLTFIPAGPFTPGESVKVTIMGKLIEDERGNNLTADYEWTFRISTEVPSEKSDTPQILEKVSAQ